MKLIRILETRKNKTGILQRWAEFLCSYCLQIVEKRLDHGLRDKSCGCMKNKLTGIGNKGKKRTEEQNEKQSKRMKGKIKSEEHKQKIRNSCKGKLPWNTGLIKEISESVKKISESKMGKRNPMYDIHNFGENSPNWNGGTSFLPYPLEFNKKLKQFILERDNYICQCPNCEHLSERLDIHHIDYNKKNNNPENLITLCNSCHSKTNGKNNRKYFVEFYQNIFIKKCGSEIFNA